MAGGVVALPITIPLAFRKETDTVHDAAVPFELLDARFVKRTCAVSPPPSPIAGKEVSRVTVLVVVWAKAAALKPASAQNVKTNFRIDKGHLLLSLDVVGITALARENPQGRRRFHAAANLNFLNAM